MRNVFWELCCRDVPPRARQSNAPFQATTESLLDKKRRGNNCEHRMSS